MEFVRLCNGNTRPVSVRYDRDAGKSVAGGKRRHSRIALSVGPAEFLAGRRRPLSAPPCHYVHAPGTGMRSDTRQERVITALIAPGRHRWNGIDLSLSPPRGDTEK